MSVRALVLVLPLGVSACGGVSPGEAARPEPPKLAAKDAQIAEAPATDEAIDALVVDWSNASRGRLEAAAQKGVVAVAYSKGRIRLVPYCKSRATYGYSAVAPKVEQVKIRDATELAAKLPLGAVDLKSALERSGEIAIAMTLVGRLEGPREALDATALEGDCETATHVLSGISLGAFDLRKGASGKVAASGQVSGPVGVGAAGSSESTMESLNRDGDVTACNQSKSTDKAPPEACRAVVRVELQALRPGSKASAATLATQKPTCAAGTSYVQGTGCVRAGIDDSALGQAELTKASELVKNECKLPAAPTYVGPAREVVLRFRADVAAAVACDQKLEAALARCTSPNCVFATKSRRGKVFDDLALAAEQMKLDVPPEVAAKIKKGPYADVLRDVVENELDDVKRREIKGLAEQAARSYAEAWAFAKARNAPAGWVSDLSKRLARLESTAPADLFAGWLAGIDGLTYTEGMFQGQTGQLAQPIVNKVIDAARPQMEACAAKGRVVDGFFPLTMAIGPDGAVVEARRDPPKKGPGWRDDPAVTACVLAVARTLKFPMPPGVSKLEEHAGTFHAPTP